MGVRASLIELSEQQGWNEDSQKDLLLRFLENLDLLLCSRCENAIDDLFDQWLENQAKWENEGLLER